MSNNAPDYENNLAFPPRHDDLQLKVNKLEKQLKIAVKCLRLYAQGKHWYGTLNPKVYDYGDWAKEALKKIGVRS